MHDVKLYELPQIHPDELGDEVITALAVIVAHRVGIPRNIASDMLRSLDDERRAELREDLLSLTHKHLMASRRHLIEATTKTRGGIYGVR